MKQLSIFLAREENMRKFVTFISLLFLIAIIGFAAPSSSISDSKENAQDNGVVKDTETGFEWYAGPDRDTSWNEAKKWVESLNVAGGGWRMPTKKELEALYKMGAGKRNMTPLLKTTGWQVWSGEKKDSSSSWGFGFGSGFEFWDTCSFSSDRRGFAVRSRKR
jgi:hypothetical protein